MNERHARHLHLVSSVGTIRTAQFEGKDHLVVPVVALVEGVIQAMNAPTPELVLAKRFSIAPSGWNGRPIFMGHPMANGHPVSGNSPIVLASSFGRIFNATAPADRLLMEAWMDPERAEAVGAKSVIDRVNSGQQIEISTGAFIVLEETKGIWTNGEAYGAIWDIIIPDHLAMLPDGATGACSLAMGCGAPRASRTYMIAAQGGYLEVQREGRPMAVPDKKEEAKPRTLRQKLSERFKTLLSTTLSDVEVRDELRQALKAKEPMLDWIEAVYSDRVIYAVYENGSQHWFARAYSSDENDTFTVADTRIEVESIQTWEPVEPEPKAAKGARHNKTDQVKIQTMHDHAVDLGAACAPKAATSVSPPCGCEPKAAAAITEGAVMKTKSERITALAANPHSPIKSKAALEACSDEELKALEETAEVGKKAAEEAATKAAAEAESKKKTDAQGSAQPEAAASQGAGAGTPETPRASQAPSEEEWLKTAPQSIRDLVSRSKTAEAAQKKDLLTSLKTAQKEYTEAELDAMPVDQLVRIARIANVPNKETVDYSGRGFPRAAEESDVYRNPPDGYRVALDKGQKGSVN